MSFRTNDCAATNRLGEVLNKIFSVETIRPAKIGVFDNWVQVREFAVMV
jgi:hypothetical protein